MMNAWPRIPLCVVAVATTACGESFVGPDLPTEAQVAGVELRAELTQTADDPTIVVVRVLASNQTGESVELEFMAPNCSVLATVYSRSVNGTVFGPPGTNACANINSAVTLGPGEVWSFPDEPTLNLRERLGASFRPGEYVIGAVIDVGTRGERTQRIELLAGRVTAR